MEIKKLKEMPIQNLAFVGDSIWELHVRDHFFKKKLKLNNLNEETTKYVNAKSQSKYYIQIEKELDEEARSFSKRGRNSNIKSFPKTCSSEEYRNATAFETLIAYYYYTNQSSEIEILLKKIILEGD